VIKLFALIPKLPGITNEKFHSHWRDPHGELAKRITELRRYSQSHSVSPAVGGLPPAIYMGIAEVHMDSVEIASAMGTDPNYTEYAAADEPNFIDQPRLAFLLCDERVHLAGPERTQTCPEIKAMLLLKRAAGLTPETFRGKLDDLAETALEATPEMDRYVQCATLDALYADGDPLYDAVVELSWPTRAAYERSWASPRVAAEHLPALAAIADLEASASLVAEPHRVIWP
jgi:uncharacterized protein (TIGR02118 family)